MTTLAKKLLYKPDAKWFAPNVPAKVKPIFEGIELTARAPKEIGFAIVFAQTEKELGAVFKKVKPLLVDASVIWFCYPKGGVDTDLSRDVVFRFLASKGLSPTRQISLDDVWTSMRFKVIS